MTDLRRQWAPPDVLLASSCITLSPWPPVHGNNCQICCSSRYLDVNGIEFRRHFCRHTPLISVISAVTLIRCTAETDQETSRHSAPWNRPPATAFCHKRVVNSDWRHPIGSRRRCVADERFSQSQIHETTCVRRCHTRWFVELITGRKPRCSALIMTRSTRLKGDAVRC